MTRNWAYRRAERRIEETQHAGAKWLDLGVDRNTTAQNILDELPKSIAQLKQLQRLYLDGNQLTALPESIVQLKQLQMLDLDGNQLTAVPESIGQLEKLESLILTGNQLTAVPESIGQLEKLEVLHLDGNPLNPELAAAYREGLDYLRAYLKAQARDRIVLNEAKLILVGEGEVGKTCLMDALQGEPWRERPSTHGIEIRSFPVVDPEGGAEITLNGWDFGGQRVYRPTHQLFFSAPAVYLVVWKPREGPQQGFVKEWIKLITHREPDAKIIVVATHGGPGQRQPDIDRQELWDLFGKETALDFHHIDSKPDEQGRRRGVAELKQAIARVAGGLPEVGRAVPKRWQDARAALAGTGAAYLPVSKVIEICGDLKMDPREARLFIRLSHRLGHLIHYEHDPYLRDIVALKPDWLATAVSFVLDDEQTRRANGLVPFVRLGALWDDPGRAAEFRYPKKLHHIFLRLMERFDLSYRVRGHDRDEDLAPTSLIGQLVPDARPEAALTRVWLPAPAAGDAQKTQICRIVDERGQSATAEGLFYQLIVRLHKFSLGRERFDDSVHWQRGLVLDDAYNGRALLRHIGNDVHITVRAPYPEGFLAKLTGEVKHLVERFWEGLRCQVMVPCIEPCGKNAPGDGLYEVEKLIASKRKGRPEYPCPTCNEWQRIDELLRNAPAARPAPMEEMIASRETLDALHGLRKTLLASADQIMGRFDTFDAGQRELLSKADASYHSLIQVMTDEAKEGPRLFSLTPVDRSGFNPRGWTRAKFRLTLWCEHSRLPLPSLDGPDSVRGVYELELSREWVRKTSPYLKLLAGALSLVLPVASSAAKLALDEAAYQAIAAELDLGKNAMKAISGGGGVAGDFLGTADSVNFERGEAMRAQGAALRELHVLLKAKDPGFGGLIRVMNNRQEFLWVHPRFEGEY